MKICQSSNIFNHLVECVLDDNIDFFVKNLPQNLNGKIDNKSFINFCLESKSKKILKNIIKNQKLINSTKFNKETFILLTKSKILSKKEKTYIYTNFIKNKVKVPIKLFLDMAMKGDNTVYKWIDIKLKNKDIYYLISFGVDRAKVNFIKRNNKNYIFLLINSVGFYGLEIENYLDFFNNDEIIKILDGLFVFSKAHNDINTTDSIIQILQKKPYLIDKIDINLLYFLKEYIQEDFFMFLKNDIDKILLFKKISKLPGKEKKHVTKI